MCRPIVFINMPAFMKAYQELQRQRKSSSVSNRLFQSLKLEDQIYDAASQKVPHLKEILKCKPRSLPIFQDIVRDLFQCFYSLKPLRRPEHELSIAARSISAPLFAQFEKDADYIRCRRDAADAVSLRRKARPSSPKSSYSNLRISSPNMAAKRIWHRFLNNRNRFSRKC